jgi:hypothetical protein
MCRFFIISLFSLGPAINLYKARARRGQGILTAQVYFLVLAWSSGQNYWEKQMRRDGLDLGGAVEDLLGGDHGPIGHDGLLEAHQDPLDPSLASQPAIPRRITLVDLHFFKQLSVFVSHSVSYFF